MSPSGGPPVHFQSVTCCLTCRGMRKADIIRRLENELGGNGRGCVSVVHSPAECRATAHQETVFSVLHRKVPWPPESVPASSPYPEAGRLFPAPLQEHLFSKPFCIRRSAIVILFSLLLLAKRPGILPGLLALISE